MDFSLDDIKLYPKNAKKHPEKQIELIAQSLIRFGWQQPIKVGKDNVIIAGHGRILAYRKYPDKIKEPWIINEEGKTIFGKPETKKLTEDEEKAYRIADNKIAESEWEMDLIQEELKTMPVDLIGYTGFKLEDEEKYTKKIEPPIYNPKEEKPNLSELYNNSKTQELIKEIKNSKIDDEVKKFLIQAAQRHCVFNYNKIADYSAQAPKEEQDLMEKSALVIIDFEKAIENGYIRATEKLLKEYNIDKSEK